MPALPEPPVLTEQQQSASEQRLVLYNVPWNHYEQLCELLAGHNVRLAYQQGTLEIMVPSMGHEFRGYSSGRIVDILAEEMGLEIVPGRTVTLRSQAVERGIEPDNCYWIANESLVRGKEEIDLDVDPPPDLFIEIEVSRSLLDRLGIAAKLRVLEVWRISGTGLKVLVLQPDGSYAESEQSAVFPGFPVMDIAPFLKRDSRMGHLAHMRRFREWVREQLESQTDSAG